jgi:hypothetical protein
MRKRTPEFYPWRHRVCFGSGQSDSAMHIVPASCLASAPSCSSPTSRMLHHMVLHRIRLERVPFQTCPIVRNRAITVFVVCSDRASGSCFKGILCHGERTPTAANRQCPSNILSTIMSIDPYLSRICYAVADAHQHWLAADVPLNALSTTMWSCSAPVGAGRGGWIRRSTMLFVVTGLLLLSSISPMYCSG